MASIVLRITCAVLISGFIISETVLAGNNPANPISISILGEFEHVNESGLYRTFLSSRNNVRLVQNKSGTQGHIRLSPDRCIAVAGWEIEEANLPETIGPAVICLTNASINARQLERWLNDDSNKVIDPSLVIPVQSDGVKQDNQQTWVNTFPVKMRLFYQRCDDVMFRGLGSVEFDSNTLSFNTFTDDTFQSQVELASKSGNLNVNTVAWNELLQCLDSKLPTTPSQGVSINFSGTSVPLPLNPKTVFGQFTGLRDIISVASHVGGLQENLASKLNLQLNRLDNNLRLNNIAKSIRILENFSENIGKLLSSGLINVKEGEQLINISDNLAESLRNETPFSDPLPLEPEPLSFCPASDQSCPVVDCSFTTFFVDDDSSHPEPDGSPARPFQNIVDALASAGKLGLCGVTIQVAAGNYFGDMPISRHTQILGPDDLSTVLIKGSVISEGSHFLRIARVTLFWYENEPADGVSAIDPCARVILSDVNVLGFRGYGIRQSGGTLDLSRVLVRDTAARPDFLTYGTGTYLTCGVQAHLSTLALINNESSGLQIWGPGTRAQAFNLTVRQTGAHPAFADVGLDTLPRGAGGVIVRGNAQLDANGLWVSDSVIVGINVTSRGQASIENASVVRTQDRDSYFGNRTDFPMGHNVAVVAEGQLSMVNFNNVDSQACGLLIARDGVANLRGGPYCNASTMADCSLISSHPIGICLQVTGFDRARILENVIFQDNRRDIEETGLPVPTPSDPVGL